MSANWGLPPADTAAFTDHARVEARWFREMVQRGALSREAALECIRISERQREIIRSLIDTRPDRIGFARMLQFRELVETFFTETL